MKLWVINLFLVLALSISTLGDVFAKTWTFNKRPLLIVLALILYTIASSLWIYWLQFNKLSVSLAWWQAFGALLTFLVGIFYFKERLTFLEALAIVMVFSGLLLLNIQQFLKQTV